MPGPRFIPTHVGNSLGLRVGLCSHTVHPHARGEQTKNNTLNSLHKLALTKSTKKFVLEKSARGVFRGQFGEKTD